MVQGIGSQLQFQENEDFLRIKSRGRRRDEALQVQGKASPLGLTLRKTPSFLSLVEMKLSQSRTKKHKTEDPEKLKATNFPALVLKIGAWERFSRHEGDLVAKCYYAKKKIVWEVLEGALKSKIEIQWRHCVKFPPGTLDKHYEKLLQCDKRLFELSKRPFPGLASPYFYSNIYGDTDVSFDFQAFQSHVPHGLHQRSFSAIPSSSFVPPNSVHNLRLPTGQPISIMRMLIATHLKIKWQPIGVQEGNNVENIYARGDQIQGLSPSLTSETKVGAAFLCHGYQIPTYGGIARRPDPNTTILSDIENHWLGNSLGPCQLFDPSKEPNFSHNIGTNQFGYEQENLSDGNAILNPTEHFEVDGGPLYPQPISYLPPQVSNANLMMPGENYQYASPFPNYEDVDAGREEQQWP
ncbi:hypothetical protein Acr_19g0001560 [Actinidia rufa]|uniref:TRF2/HOY1 PH-like domain-containing protein n=1 Tax=Actinidia rufa TaxID=165716 RepID=A0A7J0G8W0_9ERIC|nr:hypothetical protein Acr_19g0001560 [Actinidia rufa]